MALWAAEKTEGLIRTDFYELHPVIAERAELHGPPEKERAEEVYCGFVTK